MEAFQINGVCLFVGMSTCVYLFIYMRMYSYIRVSLSLFLSLVLVSSALFGKS